MPFENLINLQIKAFFFNAMTDYLPYYKNFDITVEKEATTLAILDKIKNANPNFSFPNRNIILKVNGFVTTADTSVNTLVEHFGNELTVEPATSYRSNNGLILNDDDFMQSFELLAPYATEEDKAYYETLYAVHYASETSNYNCQYIGDAILVLAHKMITAGNENKEAILEAISDNFNGLRSCEYENNILNGTDYTQTINALKEMVELQDNISIYNKILSRKRKHEVSEEMLQNSKVALYVGNTQNVGSTEALIAQNSAGFIAFEKSTKLAGQTLLNTYLEMAHQKAGTMLLNAYDSGADILVCQTEEDSKIFQGAIGHCEKVMGREIGLKIISLDTFNSLCTVTA
jgi:succinate dehydrogenase/fumarate reductase-like Fe-S protein